MKKSFLTFFGILGLVLAASPVFAATTVTVDDNSKVVVDRNGQTVTTTDQTVPAMVVQPATVAVVQPVPVVVAEAAEDPRQVEGEIIRVDAPKNTIVVQDIRGREKKIILKQGMIGNYKVDDYVKVYLMADLREAKTIQTQRTADLEGDIVTVYPTADQIVVRDRDGHQSSVLLEQGMVGSYKAGDHVRLYVVSDSEDLKEARIIRVK